MSHKSRQYIKYVKVLISDYNTSDREEGIDKEELKVGKIVASKREILEK